MYFLSATRTELLEFIFENKHAKPDIINTFSNIYLKNSCIGLFWNDFHETDGNTHFDQSNLKCIVLNDADIGDFLAWATTFLPGYSPFSAFYRIMNLTDFTRIHNSTRYSTNNLVWDPLVGIVLSETYALASSLQSTSIPLTPFNCSTSFSYLLSRCIASGYNKEIWLETFKRWKLLRDFFGLRQSPLQLEDISFICDLLEAILLSDFATTSNNHIFKIKKLIQLGFTSPEALLYFDSNINPSINTTKIMTLPREDRYRLVKSQISSSPPKDIVSCFNNAFLVNLIYPGSFEHKDFFESFANKNLMTILYGLCAGLTGTKKVREAFNYLGQRIFRDISRSDGISTIPKCDCSFLELISLYKKNDDFFKIIPYQRVVIEIFPEVEILMSNDIQRQKHTPQESLPLKDNACENNINIAYDLLGDLISDAIQIRHFLTGEIPEKTKSSKRKKNNKQQLL